VTSATSVPILIFLGLSVLDLGPMYATDRQTSDKIIAQCLRPNVVGHNKQIDVTEWIISMLYIAHVV